MLQSIFEYQTMICELTGMDVANASVYDGASAAAEAVAMCREKKRNAVLVSAAAHPMVLQTIGTYCFGSGMEVRTVPMKNGFTDIEALEGLPPQKIHCSVLAEEAVKAALEDYYKRKGVEMPEELKKKAEHKDVHEVQE